MVLLEIGLEGLWQLKLVDTVVGRARGDDGAAEVLKGKREVPVQRVCQHRLEEHAAGRVLVVLDQAADLLSGERFEVVYMYDVYDRIAQFHG